MPSLAVRADFTLVLLLSLLLLLFGALSMFIVRWTSPNLKGVGWFGASFASGAFAAGFLLTPNHPFVAVLCADLALLASFALQHVAVLQLGKTRRIPLWHGALLLSSQGLLDVAQLAGYGSSQLRTEVFGVLVAMQVVATAVVLWRQAGDQVKAPAVFSMVLLGSFGAFHLLRSALLISGVLTAQDRDRLTFIALALYLAVALGLAFGFFWITNATLTAEVAHMGSTDPLTRVYNRRVFLKWCEKELLRSQRSRVPFSLLMVDLDHFKQVNDNFGHQRGDEVLCAAVERMQDSVRGIDVICRWGGEEFAVLLPNAPVHSTRIVAERIRANVERLDIQLTSPTTGLAGADRLTVSIGAATYRDLDDDLSAMLLRADRALYRAKSNGRNQVLIGS